MATSPNPEDAGIAAVVRELQRQGWQIETRLGRGGFGEVYRARIDNMLRAVRISLDPIGQRSAQREQKILQQLADLRLLSHPRLVSLVAFRIVLGYLVTAWELADEPIRDLARLLQHYREQGQPGIPRDRLLRHMFHLAEAIDFLNERGLFHRDIKPENCLLFQGEVKLADFGLTRFVSVSQSRLSTTAGGSVGYAPPETWENRHHASCDLYSLAVMYAYLASGKHPFGADEPGVSQLQVVERQRAGQWNLSGLSEGEAACVMAALQPDQQKRFAGSARKWVQTLYKGKPSAGQAPPLPPKPKPGLVVQAGVRLGLATAETETGLVVHAGRVARARPGSVIELQPGVYLLEQPLRIDKPLTMQGAGADKTFIQSDAEGCVIELASTGLCALRDLSVEHFGNRPANVVVVSLGMAEISGCVVRGGVWDEKRKFGGDGICFTNATRGTVRGCVCRNNGLRGIEISGIAQPLLEGNTCEGNMDSGIAYFDSAGGTARQNVCRQNGHHGIGVQGQAQPQLEGNTCEGNNWQGIAFSEKARGLARKNTCQSNRNNGIAVWGEAQPQLECNTCENNTYSGIAYFDSAGGMARQNICRHNGYHGIGVNGQAQPQLECNTCENNTYNGIAYFDSAGGSARQNICRHNGYAWHRG
jgi:parallel beta-helix repeat protein